MLKDKDSTHMFIAALFKVAHGNNPGVLVNVDVKQTVAYPAV